MKKTVFTILVCLAVLCTVVAVVTGVLAYLAVTGLDLLVTAKKTMPKVAISLAIAAGVLWLASLAVFLGVKNGSPE
ncbi:MAG: hypothetical protein II553_03075 [Lachnospiraceae bacterium]|nr:hypothetical protein [Lachnospiraceae bacterium]